jgi:hypothetical protein
MQDSWLSPFINSDWHGQAELWVDPAGNEVGLSECQLSFDADGLTYTWAYDGKAQSGIFRLGNIDATWSDTWHQSETVTCSTVLGMRGLFALEYAYGAGEEADWAWRSQLSQRPDGTLVLQMTNITPWGEEGRAVRMIVRPLEA